MKKTVKEYDDMEDALDELGQVLERNEQKVRDRYWKKLEQDGPKLQIPTNAQGQPLCRIQEDTPGEQPTANSPALIIPKDANGNPLCRMA